jgi:hypothetical protein
VVDDTSMYIDCCNAHYHHHMVRDGSINGSVIDGSWIEHPPEVDVGSFIGTTSWWEHAC